MGTIKFEDNFSDNKNKWHTCDDEKGLLKFQDKKYVIEYKQNTSVWMAYMPVKISDDEFTMHVTMQKEYGPDDKWYGVMWGLGIDGFWNYFAFLISGNGYYYVGKTYQNQWHTLKDTTYTSYINQMNGTNSLDIKKAGNSIEFAVNQFPVDKLTFNEPLFGNNFGFALYDKMRVSVHKIVVTGQEASKDQGKITVTDMAKEAELFLDSIQPFIKTLDSDALENFGSLLTADIATVYAASGHADGKPDSDEELAAIFFLYLVALSCDHSASRGDIISALYKWKDMPPNKKEQMRSRLKELCEEVKKGGFRLPCLEHAKGLSDTSSFDKLASFLYRVAQVIVKANGKVMEEEEKALKKVYELIYKQTANVAKESTFQDSKLAFKGAVRDETLQEVLDELHSLVGMANIKHEVVTLTNLLSVQKRRMERGMQKIPVSLHSVFYGPPGTGKTTVARLLGRIYKNLALLSKGHLVETDRAGLVAGYIGQTAIKVDETVKSALDGVLFVDEAYALQAEHIQNDFGQEAVSTLLKRMEDYRGRLVVIVAGYTDEMQRFIESNPGLKSRFNRYFFFDHYKPEELLAIFEKFCRDGHFKLTPGARNTLLSTFEFLYNNRERTFGNGRLARNIFEKAIERQANRIISIAPLTDEVLTTITGEDIPLAIEISDSSSRRRDSNYIL